MQRPIGRRTVLKTIGAAGAALAVGGVGTASARRGRGPRGRDAARQRQGASADPTLVEFAIAANTSGPYAGQFDTLIAGLVAKPALLKTLNTARGQYTVFAPVDDAFAAIGFDEANADDIPADVLAYHLTRGRRYAKSVLGAPRLRMLNKGFVTQDGGVLNDGQATIVATDFEASNGVLHAIDGVLLES
ncbi:fasciclin domain-containing protein [Halapricum salinum]|uniref:Fasciclin domain-containing protein n=1 Tax=Halapricum salinum TaxID=1457250 RepID=A0A4D6HG24_9EURY|nr:fasciclin domain-containing protein [Halapricum salinum]QCC51992.1 fasciclin domain-containing protein [Halapricum salinum]